VVADAEEPAAEAALAPGDGLVERLRLWLERRRGAEMLYVEMAPFEGDPQRLRAGVVTALPR
jgi:hypothetical protein